MIDFDPMHVDLNCDLGEMDSIEGRRIECEILQHVTSANVACGAHAGDESRMRDVAALCREHDVAFGAHPGYPDRLNFGRRVIPMSPSSIQQLVAEQIGLAAEIAAAEGISLHHVKPHGALYNLAACDAAVAEAIVFAVREMGNEIKVLGLSGSLLITCARHHGLAAISEVFADRNYRPDGSLVPRDQAHSVLTDQSEVLIRAVEMVRSGLVISDNGSAVSLVAESICVHSDTANAVNIVRQLRQGLLDYRIAVRRP